MTVATITLDKTAVKKGETFTALLVTDNAVNQLRAGQFAIYDAATGQLSASARVTSILGMASATGGTADGADTLAGANTRYWRVTMTANSDVDLAQVYLGLNMTGAHNSGGAISDPTIYRSSNFFIDSQGPTLSSATSRGKLVILSYNDNNGSGLDANHAPAKSAFRVSTNDGTELDIATVTVDASTSTVTLTLSNDIPTGVTPSVSYTAPTEGNVLQDRAGNGAANLTNRTAAVSNDSAAPTMATTGPITFSKTSIKSGETTTVTFKFSEAVRGFELADVVVPDNCTLSNPVASNPTDGASTTWTATLTGKADINASDVKLSVHLSGVVDTAGNSGRGDSADSPAISVDTRKPALVADGGIKISKTTLKAGETTEVLFTFISTINRDGFGVDDIVLSNGWTITKPESLDTFGESRIYKATLTPPANSASASTTISVKLDGVRHNTEYGEGTSQSSQTVSANTARPTLQASNISIADDKLKIGDTSSVTFTFSEAVSGFGTDDVTGLDSATLSNMQALDEHDNPITSANPSSIKWRATLTPADDKADTSNKLTVHLDGVTNAAGNAGAGTVDSANYEVNTQRPTLTSAVFADTALKAGETSTVIFTFSEAVTGFAIDDVTGVPDGTLASMQALNDDNSVKTGDNPSSNKWSATFTPNGNVNAPSNHLTVNLAGVTNAAGNAGTGNAESSNYAIDTQRPTLTSVAIVDTALKAGETSAVTFTFSEAVTGFGTDDVTAPNAILSNMQALNADDSVMTGNNPSSNKWRATLTPNPNAQVAENKLTVNLAGVQDAAGNAGSGNTESTTNYAVDTQRPRLAPTDGVRFDNSTLKIGSSTTVTFTFTEKVTGFAIDDVTGFAPNARLTGMQAVDTNGNVISGDNPASTTWRATLTPEDGKQSATNTLTIDQAGVTDLSGNTGTGTANSGNFIVDTVPPSVSSFVIARSQTPGLIATYQLRLTFSEKIKGLTADKLTAENATISNLASSDGGTTWTATLTANPDVEDSSNRVLLSLANVTDDVGNNFVQTTSTSDNYVIDSRPPVFETATANELRLVLYYTESSSLNADNKADPSAFVVRADGQVINVLEVNVDAASKTVTLTLGRAITNGQTVTLDYTDPDGDTVNATQDAAGNDAASFTGRTVINYTPAPTPNKPSGPGPDTDRDGVSNSVENQATGLKGTADGDGNGDGIPDSQQGAVASASFAIGATGQSNSAGLPTGYTTLVAGGQDGKPAADDGGGSKITALLQKDTPAYLPKGLEMPMGLTSFNAQLGTGLSTENFSLYVDASLGVNGYWIKDSAGVWVNLASDAYGGKMSTEGDRLRLDFKITDGSEFDADGQVDGSITAPGAAAHMALSVLGQPQDAAPNGYWF